MGKVISPPRSGTGHRGGAGEGRMAQKGREEEKDAKPKDLSRRGILRIGAAGAAAGAAGGLMLPRRALAQSPLTPDQAIAELMEGNRRYVERKFTSFREDLDILHDRTAEKQEPFAAVLSCADSRVPVELLFDQSIGHLFVCRVAGNVSTPEILASLEYGAKKLGTKAILVLGHGRCGAVDATLAGAQVPGQISVLYSSIRPGIDGAKPGLEAAIKANARFQARQIAEASPLIAKMIKDEEIKVIAGFYDLVSGRVTRLT